MPTGSPDTEMGSHPAYALTLAAVAAIGGFLFGFDSGVINGTVSALQAAFASDSIGTGFSVASMLLGCALGALLSGRVADRYGRKPVMVVTALLFLLSALGSGWADSSSVFILARVLGGLGVGAASVIAPTYIAEVAPAAWRGRLASLQQLAIVIGLFMAFVSNYAVARAAGSAQATWLAGAQAWRWMFWMECVPALAYLFGSLLIPESPRFLVASGQVPAARRIFAQLLGGDPDRKIAAVQASLQDKTRVRFHDLCLPGRLRLRPVVWIGLGAAMLQQLVGINVIFYYGAVLWQAVGFSEQDALWQNVISGLVNTLSTLVALTLVDRIGRKPLLLAGSAGMALTLGALAWLFGHASPKGTGALDLSPGEGWTALVLALTYVFFFAATWGPVLWVLLGEIFPNRIRGTATAAVTMAHWLANFAITMSFPWLLHWVGLGLAYTLYAGAAAFSFLFVQRWVHETRGRVLEEAHPYSASAGPQRP
ncbi:MAG: sugar porter family MFS transporter [Polyangiales bacterium]